MKEVYTQKEIKLMEEHGVSEEKIIDMRKEEWNKEVLTKSNDDIGFVIHPPKWLPEPIMMPKMFNKILLFFNNKVKQG